MSIRHLEPLFDPRSVAVVGASDERASVGATVWRNLRAGFAGPCWAVNPNHAEIGGEPAFRDVAALPQAPDLAVICTPPAAVPGVIEALGARGTRAAIVLSAGLDAAQKQAMLDAARRYLLRILGPNCIGLISPHAGLNASFAHTDAQRGSVAFVSQSGALLTAMLDWAGGRGIGFSHCISLGEHADIDFADLLDWLASDSSTRSIVLYVEGIDRGRKFMSAARAAARNKPVIVVKAGRSERGKVAAASHTGALAGSDLVFDAAIRRAGMLRVDTLQDLFVAVETLDHFSSLPVSQGPQHRDRLTLVTNGGGAGVMAADAAESAGVELASLSAATLQSLDAGLPHNWSGGNPVDIIGDAPIERYVGTVKALLGDPETGTLLLMHAPTAIVSSIDIAAALVPIVGAARGRVIACWLGDAAVRDARRLFQEAGVPCFDTPEEAVRAFSMVNTYRRNQQQLMQTPSARRRGSAADWSRVHALVDAALAEGRELLSEAESKALLAASGIPVVDTRVTPPDADAAVAAAQSIGFPVALKLVSPQVTHKSDVGGVVLGLEDAQAVRDAVATMLRRVSQQRPEAAITGLAVQPMIRRASALELIVGATVDPVFGPVLMFGQGGTAVEVLADRALALPPLNTALALALVERTRVARLLHGWRDVPAADIDAVVETLIAVSELLASEPRIAELDVNPLLADARGVLALDARIRVDAASPGGAAKFAIVPYPSQLSESFEWQGATITLRPIRPEDEIQHRAFLAKVDPEDMRMRFFMWRRSIEHGELARLTQIDYDREMAFVAVRAQASGEEETIAVARAICDPDNEDAEFAIVVRSDLKGCGLGRRLTSKLIEHSRSRGTARLTARVLVENVRMLALARALGFVPDAVQPEPGVRNIHLALQTAATR